MLFVTLNGFNRVEVIGDRKPECFFGIFRAFLCSQGEVYTGSRRVIWMPFLTRISSEDANKTERDIGHCRRSQGRDKTRSTSPLNETKSLDSRGRRRSPLDLDGKTEIRFLHVLLFRFCLHPASLKGRGRWLPFYSAKSDVSATCCHCPTAPLCWAGKIERTG